MLPISLLNTLGDAEAQQFVRSRVWKSAKLPDALRVRLAVTGWQIRTLMCESKD